MKKIAALLAFILLTNLVSAQDLTSTWSDKEFYTNKTTGFFDHFVGGNSKYVYAKCSKVPAFGGGKKRGVAGEKKSKINLIAYDRATMKEAANATILDISKDKKYAGLNYYKTIVFENSIYVFWVSDTKAKDELYVASYDSKLKKVNALKKIYELASSKGDLRKAELFVMGNQKAGEKIIIGGELATDEGQDIKMEYKLLNSDFTFASSGQVTLPVIAAKGLKRNLLQGSGSDALSSTYLFGDDGNLHLRTYVRVNDEEKKDLKKGMDKSYAIYSIVDVSSGKIHSFSMKADNKNILEFDFKVIKNSIKLFGFFNDINKGGTINGIFTASVDPKAYTITNLNFSYFTKDQLATLFAKDQADANKGGIFASKKKKDDAKESLAANYTIEDVQSIDKDNLVLFTSKMWNYTTRTCDSKGNCYTNYYCQKDNITVFKLNAKGDIVWATNLDRRKTYGGWYVYDVKVINKDKNFYIAYGSDYNTTEKDNGKTKKSRKSKDQRTDRLEYAMFDYNTGAIQRKELKINAVNAPKAEMKSVVPLKMEVINNEFYVNSTKGKLKPWIYALWLCPPVGCASTFIIPGAKKWTCYNGKIAPMK